IILSLRSSTSVSSNAPPACAIASTISTPGMIGSPGKCPAKNGSVKGHVLDGDDPVLPLQIEHAIDQQKRIAMRQNLQNVVDIEHGFGLCGHRSGRRLGHRAALIHGSSRKDVHSWWLKSSNFFFLGELCGLSFAHFAVSEAQPSVPDHSPPTA